MVPIGQSSWPVGEVAQPANGPLWADALVLMLELALVLVLVVGVARIIDTSLPNASKQIWSPFVLVMQETGGPAALVADCVARSANEALVSAATSTATLNSIVFTSFTSR